MTLKDYAAAMAGALLLAGTAVFVMCAATVMGFYCLVGYVFTMPSRVLRAKDPS